MAINKIVLEKDGLVVGSNQLVASGNGIYIGNNLVVAGNTYLNNLSVNGIDIGSLSSTVGGIVSNSVVMTGLYNSGNTITNASGLINNISQGYLTVSNIVYNNNGLPTSFVETYSNTNTTYAYTVSYYSNNDIATITRV
jgi:hypothetical protein